MKAREARLAIIQDGECDPYRHLDLAEPEEARERHVCVECRHHEERGHRCLRAPTYEERLNFVSGETMFFDRAAWEQLLANRRRWGDDFLKARTEKDYFHPSQTYGSCFERNTDGLCEDYEGHATTDEAVARPGLPRKAWLAIGFLLGLAAQWPFL